METIINLTEKEAYDQFIYSIIQAIIKSEKKKDSIKRLINKLSKQKGIFNKVINYYKIKYLKTLLLIHNEQSLNQRYLLNFHYSKDEN